MSGDARATTTTRTKQTAAASGTDGTSGTDTPRRRATLAAVLAGVLVLAVAATVLAGAQSARLRDPGGNAALADRAATEEVTEQVGAGLKAIFSYDYNNLARTERAADRVLVGRAVGQYRERFAEAREQAERQRLVRTTTVRSIGVKELHGGTARLLVFLDQQTLRAGAGGEDRRQDPVTAVLDVTAEKSGGEWRIADLTPL
ncbi:Mce-associated membrane protein [Prauserella shujinwangii]|uniref:Mce-associated membrane protein n=1 Tax=Prauserella shujinwangii TaxID=1453103 RepID=A0A2T0LS88_9PSEU|nr:hypothetical protein [Prauserella shujinwangii]PRX46475.1 Mce-associated membrane protein [Prauserella shujinwangii]